MIENCEYKNGTFLNSIKEFDASKVADKNLVTNERIKRFEASDSLVYVMTFFFSFFLCLFVDAG